MPHPDRAAEDSLLPYLAEAVLAPVLDETIICGIVARGSVPGCAYMAEAATRQPHRTAALARAAVPALLDPRLGDLSLAQRLADLPNLTLQATAQTVVDRVVNNEPRMAELTALAGRIVPDAPPTALPVAVRHATAVIALKESPYLVARARYRPEEAAILAQDLYWTAFLAIALDPALRQLVRQAGVSVAGHQGALLLHGHTVRRILSPIVWAWQPVAGRVTADKDAEFFDWLIATIRAATLPDLRPSIIQTREAWRC